MFYKLFFPVLLILLSVAVTALPKVSYTKLSDEAKKTGQLDYYNNAETTDGSIVTESYVLNYSMPKTVRAYDSVPIDYTLIRKPGAPALYKYVSAVAGEDVKRSKGRPLYNMALPGNLKVNIEYLGNISADYDDTNYPYLTPNPREAKPLDYIPLKRYDFLESTTAKAADCVWFKFRVTNTGNTILSPEGFGRDYAFASIMKVNDKGENEWDDIARTINLYERHLDYIYPGESWTCWVQFCTDKFFGWPGRNLVEGKYKISFNMIYKYNREYNYELNVWHGKDFAVLEFPITVKKEAEITPIKVRSVNVEKNNKMPIYLSKFEEFMTSFDYYDAENNEDKISDTMYLQVAPWTKDVVIKLILGDDIIKAARVPVNINLDNLDIKYNPDNPMVIQHADGSNEPAIVAMAMPGMRTNFQLGPYPELHMENDIAEMKALGVNLIANTSGNWWMDEVSGKQQQNHILEPCKIGYRYWYDYLMRKYDMKAMGWSIYPPTGMSLFNQANEAFNLGWTHSENPNTYQSRPGIDFADPVVPKVINVWTKYIYERWGDYWFTDKTGKVSVDCEDTWGWMRMDVNLRYDLGPLGMAKFREYLKAKYITIEAVNTAWKSDFKDFEEINPDKVSNFAEQKSGAEMYNSSNPVFHDWTAAMEDFDVFRTQLRMSTYKESTRLINEYLPNAQMSVRTEGSNFIAKGNPQSADMDERHVYYSQRRNAMVYDAVKESQALHSYSDYTTMAYTLSDWRRFLKETRAAGIVPGYLPNFSSMRDILINDYYGKDYQVSYNLDAPKKGMMIQVLQSAYPIWKIMYEEGGAPGMIWSDYLCDAFAATTQKKELFLLSEEFRQSCVVK